MFSKVQVLQGPGSRSRVRVQVLEVAEVNKHGLLKTVSISSSQRLILKIFLGKIFSSNETSEGRRIHMHNSEFVCRIRLDSDMIDVV